MNDLAMQTSLRRKQYISVRAEFRDDGIMLPQSIFWTGGREYPVDRVKNILSARSRKTDERSDRYTVEIGGRECIFSLNAIRNRMSGRWAGGTWKPGNSDGILQC